MSNTVGNYAIIVYGGTFSGVVAADNAARLLPDESVLVVNPSPDGSLDSQAFRSASAGPTGRTTRARWRRR